jgi:hypothetical protein
MEEMRLALRGARCDGGGCAGLGSAASSEGASGTFFQHRGAEEIHEHYSTTVGCLESWRSGSRRWRLDNFGIETMQRGLAAGSLHVKAGPFWLVQVLVWEPAGDDDKRWAELITTVSDG